MSVFRVGNKSSESPFPKIRPTLDLDFANSKTLDPRITFRRASGGSYFGPDGRLRYAGVNEPRFTHDPVTGESLGLLVEEGRTNLKTGSQDFSNTYWSSSNAVRTNNNATAPDGTTTACLVAGSGGVFGGLVRTFGGIYSASTTYAFSCFAKAGTHNVIGLRTTSSCAAGDNYCYYNLSTGVATAITPSAGTVASVSMTPFPNGWYRCVLVYTTSASQPGTGDVIDIALTNATGNHNYNGTGTILIWGAQLEAGAFPTSYIPTTTSAVTRSADVASITGAAFSSWYRQDEGSFFGSVNASRGTVMFGTGDTFDNTVYALNGASLNVFFRSGGSNQAVLTAPVSTNGITNLAFGFQQNNFAACSNGGSISVDTSGSVAQNQVRLKIGSSSWDTTGDNSLNGTIRRLTYWPARLPNSTLQRLTR